MLAASAAGRSTAEQPDQGEVVIWRVDDGEVLHRLTGHAKRPMAVAFTPDGGRLALNYTVPVAE